MSQPMVHNFREIDELAGLRAISSDFGCLSGDYIVCRFSTDTYEQAASVSLPAFKIGALTLCLVEEGERDIEINQQTYAIKKNTLIVFGSSDVVRHVPRNGGRITTHLLCISIKFIQDLNIDLSTINLQHMFESPRSNAVELKESEAEALIILFKALKINACENTEVAFAKNIARSLTQALFYQLMQVKANHRPRIADTEGTASRKIQYVQEFMRLLQLHHTSSRSISFYANRLCISPKYLSHLVKETTGRSAAEWVAELVVQEAKNMLRYSDKNVQQVAYALNFASQSSFGKYFKHATGISPSDYQKS